MKLYYAPGACSLSPHIVAREAGVDVQLAKVDLRSHKVEDGADTFTATPPDPGASSTTPCADVNREPCRFASTIPAPS